MLQLYGVFPLLKIKNTASSLFYSIADKKNLTLGCYIGCLKISLGLSTYGTALLCVFRQHVFWSSFPGCIILFSALFCPLFMPLKFFHYAYILLLNFNHFAACLVWESPCFLSCLFSIHIFSHFWNDCYYLWYLGHTSGVWIIDVYVWDGSGSPWGGW